VTLEVQHTFTREQVARMLAALPELSAPFSKARSGGLPAPSGVSRAPAIQRDRSRKFQVPYAAYQEPFVPGRGIK
jgi:hypothetical protein